MKRLVASALVAALMFGMFTASAEAASPAARDERAVEGNRRPVHAFRPAPPWHGRQVSRHYRPLPQPPRRVHGHRRDQGKSLGVGVIVGAVLGAVITHMSHR